VTDESGEGPEDDQDDFEDDYDEDDYEDDYRPARSRRMWIAVAAAIMAVVGLGLGLGLTLAGGSASGAVAGPEGVPIQPVPDLASADSTVTGAPVDGMTCRATMDQKLAYHIHVHLDVFVNGQQERIPAGAGITSPRASEQFPGGVFLDSGTGDCLYWLHVHADDGIIHVESPVKKTFVLGQFFDVWGQPLGPDQVGPAHGPVVAYENGKRFTGNPRDIPLLPQAVVQLDVGNPVVPFKPMKFNVTGLCSSSCSALPTSSSTS
jgi:hypothetical protein